MGAEAVLAAADLGIADATDTEPAKRIRFQGRANPAGKRQA
jgi:hypothetical protein